MAWARANFGGLLAGAIGVFALSMTGLILLREKQIMLSLKPIGESASQDMAIELSRRQIRKKKLTIAGSDTADVVLQNPSLKDIQVILSFVRVGGRTKTYLSHKSNKAVQINENTQHNPRLKDGDKIRLGDVTFEVHARGR